MTMGISPRLVSLPEARAMSLESGPLPLASLAKLNLAAYNLDVHETVDVILTKYPSQPPASHRLCAM